MQTETLDVSSWKTLSIQMLLGRISKIWTQISWLSDAVLPIYPPAFNYHGWHFGNVKANVFFYCFISVANLNMDSFSFSFFFTYSDDSLWVIALPFHLTCFFSNTLQVVEDTLIFWNLYGGLEWWQVCSLYTAFTVSLIKLDNAAECHLCWLHKCCLGR